MKKIISAVLAIAMVLALSLSVSAYTINTDDAQIGAGEIFGTAAVYFNDATVVNGDTVTVDLMVEDNNEGFTELKITVAADDGISVSAVENGDLGTASYTDGVITVTADETIEVDGCVAKIVFAASAEGVKNVVLTATGKNAGDTIGVLGSECLITVEAAVSEGIPGDIDENGAVNTTDLALLKLALAGGGTDTLPNADFDSDGVVNTTDLAKLKLFLAGA